MFIFDGGQLDDDQAEALKPTDDELTGLRFLPYEQYRTCVRRWHVESGPRSTPSQRDSHVTPSSAGFERK
ncbi:hypothetical protein [Micromonospora sp. NPDC093277]|uniref:hypothetical protein n=1 Tax=Micromonospora sp. NPDC093277 TaxID=3364291 RepID=UPI0038238235